MYAESATESVRFSVFLIVYPKALFQVNPLKEWPGGRVRPMSPVWLSVKI